jgi:mRNA interferase MazF
MATPLRFAKGDVVVLPFPFSDMSATKRRPALVVSDVFGKDVLLSQITSQNNADPYVIKLENSHFTTGSLAAASLIRTNRLFTADIDIILYRVGNISQAKYEEVSRMIANLVAWTH